MAHRPLDSARTRRCGLALAAVAAPAVVALAAWAPPARGATPAAETGAERAAVASGSWSEPAVWGGASPGPGDVAVIPAGVAVTLDHPSGALDLAVRGIEVRGELLCGRSDVTATATWVMVHGGRLACGAAAEPFTGELRLRLAGGHPGDDVMGMGTNVLGAMHGGSLELHGRPVRSWTQLRRTADAGSATIALAAAPAGWRAGDRIAIASTDFEMEETEIRTIAAVRGDEIDLDRPLEHRHFGEVQTYGDGVRSWTLDERAEVALLTRSIVVEGDEASVATGFGGHVMVMLGARAHLESVELTRLGQLGRIARYAFHWHLLGDTPGQEIRGSAIHHTYNRCVVVHGTNGAVVADNACVDNVGHAFFVEDGSERDNLVTGNVGMLTRAPAPEHALLPTDVIVNRNAVGPATFWITNPVNTVTDNRAAGSDGSGIWIAPNRDAIDPVTRQPVRNLPLGDFDRNVAHSSFGHGFVLGFGPGSDGSFSADAQYEPPVDPRVSDGTVFKNGMATYTRLGSPYESMAGDVPTHRITLHLDRWVHADNREGTINTFSTVLSESLWVGESANASLPPPWIYEHSNAGPLAYLVASGTYANALYDGPVRIVDSHFTGWARPDTSLLQHSFAFSHPPGQTIERTTIDPGSLPPTLWVETWGAAAWFAAHLEDLDGSITGRAGTSIAQDQPIMVDGSCSRLGRGNTMSCPHRYGWVQIFPGPSAFGGFSRQPAIWERSDGPSFLESYVPAANTGSVVTTLFDSWQMSTILEKEIRYRLRFGAYTPAGLDLRTFNAAGDVIRIDIPRTPSTAYLLGTTVPARPAASLAELERSDRTGWLWADNTLHLKLRTGGDGRHFERFYVCMNAACGGLDQRLPLVVADYEQGIDGRSRLESAARTASPAPFAQRVEPGVAAGDGANLWHVDATCAIPSRCAGAAAVYSLDLTPPAERGEDWRLHEELVVRYALGCEGCTAGAVDVRIHRRDGRSAVIGQLAGGGGAGGEVRTASLPLPRDPLFVDDVERISLSLPIDRFATRRPATQTVSLLDVSLTPDCIEPSPPYAICVRDAAEPEPEPPSLPQRPKIVPSLRRAAR